MKRSSLAIAFVAASSFVAACQAIVGIGDRTEAAALADGGDGADTSSGSSSGGGSSSSGGSSSGGSSSGSSGADAGDGGDASKGYDVRSLPGLRLWLESTKELSGSGGTALLATWFDQSGAWDAGADGAPDGGRHVALPRDPNPPSIEPNGINGRPSLSFVTGNGYVQIANHTDFRVGLGDFMIVEVAKVVSGDGPLWQLRQNVSTGREEQLLHDQLCVEFPVMDGCTSPAFTPPAGPHVFVGRRKGDTFTFRVDGTVKGSLDRTSDPPDISILEYQQPYVFIGNGITMLLSEVVVAVGPTSDADLAALETYLKGKYGIP